MRWARRGDLQCPSRSAPSPKPIALEPVPARELPARDAELAESGRLVGRLSRAIGIRLGLAPRRAIRLELAGTLHDIGTLYVPRAILEKPDPLSEDERERIRLHPIAGAELIRAQGLHDVAEWVLNHHERPDGRGYPRGLFDHEIPLEAKVLAVADAWEGMTSWGPHRIPLDPIDAAAELKAGAGTQFDPAVVDALLLLSPPGRAEMDV